MCYEGIKFKKDIKPILEAIDNLTSWDKEELITYLTYDLSQQELEEMCDINGFHTYSEEDCVQNVIDNNNEYRILNSMSTDEIIDYIIDECGNNFSYELSCIFDRLDDGSIVENLDANRIEGILDKISDEFPDEVKDWITEIIRKGLK